MHDDENQQILTFEKMEAVDYVCVNQPIDELLPLVTALLEDPVQR